MSKFNWKEWAFFGAIVAGIKFLILALLAIFIVTGVTADAGLSLITSLIATSVIVVAVIYGAVSWAILGFIYEKVLHQHLKKNSLLIKIFVCSVVVGLAIDVLTLSFGVMSSVLQLIGSFIGSWLTVLVVKYFNIKVPKKLEVRK